ncbi:unnamed protein product [Sphenostylis stenocarpa]|uniref:Protein kinase domain-containing protein n=1 Tax=Sphenostylis stenocarpa TaxID=92480 RepID=A0AA86S9D1_9FABA|nr:unnamed protein product [Sphenostylis stenocarpa]CAJ1947756.1 unnamed protein product [Sphenostylis stenocarpa]
MANWKKLEIIGNGSYATVYLAAVMFPQEESNWKVTAVKSSRPFPYSFASLRKEKKILELFIGCKEILQCFFYTYTIERGFSIYNLFMEFAPYGSLADLIRKGPLPEKEVILCTHMLLKGLSCIHGKGIVHCDLKPDNILLFPSSEDPTKFQLKISDFGLSKIRGERNADFGQIKFRGTPFYMSPESLVGLLEASLDIWSLGCIVIEMITGFPAWRDLETRDDLMFKLAFLQEAPEIPYELDWDCKSFLRKCFMKDPRQRWTATMLLTHPFMQKEYPTSFIINNSSSFFLISYDIVSYVLFIALFFILKLV